MDWPWGPSVHSSVRAVPGHVQFDFKSTFHEVRMDNAKWPCHEDSMSSSNTWGYLNQVSCLWNWRKVCTLAHARGYAIWFARLSWQIVEYEQSSSCEYAVRFMHSNMKIPCGMRPTPSTAKNIYCNVMDFVPNSWNMCICPYMVNPKIVGFPINASVFIRTSMLYLYLVFFLAQFDDRMVSISVFLVIIPWLQGYTQAVLGESTGQSFDIATTKWGSSCAATWLDGIGHHFPRLSYTVVSEF